MDDNTLMKLGKNLEHIYPYNLYCEIIGNYDPIDLLKLSPFNLLYQIDQLDSKRRGVIEARFLNNLTYIEISKEFNIPDRHIFQLLQSSIEKLRKRMLGVYTIERSAVSPDASIRKPSKKTMQLFQPISENTYIEHRYNVMGCPMSTHLRNCLRRAGIIDLRSLEYYTENEVHSIQGLGVKSYNELQYLMDKLNVQFRS